MLIQILNAFQNDVTNWIMDQHSMVELLRFNSISEQIINLFSPNFGNFRNMILIVSLETKENGGYDPKSEK